MGVVVIILAIAVMCVFGGVCVNVLGNSERNKVGYFFLGFFFTLMGVAITYLVTIKDTLVVRKIRHSNMDNFETKKDDFDDGIK